MKIVCTIPRKGGTIASIDGVEYHFTPEEEGGPDIAQVADAAHVARFLAIPGYEAADAVEEQQFIEASAHQTAEQRLEEQVEPEDPTQPDPSGSTYASLAPEARLEEEVAPLEEKTEAEIVARVDEVIDDIVGLDDQSLAYAYRDEFGEMPHHRMKRDTVIQRLREARREKHKG